MRSWRALVVGVAAAAVVLAACGGSSSKSSSNGKPSLPSLPVSLPSSLPSLPSGQNLFNDVRQAAASNFTVSLAAGSQGIYEVGPNGHTLYFFAKDTGTTSACTGACASTWPALTSSGAPTGGPGVEKSQLGTANGQVPNQVTYYGHLLYYFSGDSAPGDTKGVGIPNWFLLGPRGNQMQPR